VYANGTPHSIEVEANEDGERGSKKPRVEVSKLASWGDGKQGIRQQPKPSSYLEHKPPEMLAVREKMANNGENSLAPPGKVHIQGVRSKYIGPGDRMALLDHVSPNFCQDDLVIFISAESEIASVQAHLDLSQSFFIQYIEDSFSTLDCILRHMARWANLEQFSDEKSFLFASFRDAQLAPTMSEIMGYHKAFSPKRKPVSRLSINGETMFSEMLQALPDDTMIDALLLRYVSNLENVMRIVHIPSFRMACWEIKVMRQSQISKRPVLANVPEAALPQLLAAMVIASRLNDFHQPGAQQLPETLVSQYLDMIQDWLGSLKGKQRITLSVIQAETLLLIAKTVKTVPAPQLWKDSGSLIRVAMIMGLHRDPISLAAMSLFEKIQRRKIWQTIVELDLQVSLAIGLPPAIQSSDFNMEIMVNVDDDDLAENMTEYPMSEPHSVWTDASPQIFLATSIRERLDTAHILARDIDIDNDAADLLARAKGFEKAHQILPNMLPSSSKRRHTLFSGLLLDVFIRRFSLAIYRTIALSDQGPNYPEAQRGTLRSSVAVLSHLDALDPTVADPDTIKSRNYLNLFHIMCKNDINQAALLLCYEIHALRSPGREQPSIHDESTPWTKHSLIRIVENTLNSHLQRIGEFEGDLKMVLPLSVVLHSVRSDGSSSGKRELMVRGVERVLAACRKALPDYRIPAWKFSTHLHDGRASNNQIVSIIVQPFATYSQTCL
jgi:hypothetical protein